MMNFMIRSIHFFAILIGDGLMAGAEPPTMPPMKNSGVVTWTEKVHPAMNGRMAVWLWPSDARYQPKFLYWAYVASSQNCVGFT
jgi:hypothetical protein